MTSSQGNTAIPGVIEDNSVLPGGAKVFVFDGPEKQFASKSSLPVGGTKLVTLDFTESDDEVFDDEANDERLARLSSSTINVETRERDICQLGERVSTGELYILFLFLFACYCC